MNNLRHLRKQAKVSRDEFAMAMGVRPVTLTAWENGTRTLMPEKAKLAIAVLAERGVYVGLDAIYAVPTGRAA